MRLCICDFPGYAFAAELSRNLARSGHQVRHIYAQGIPAPTGRLTTEPSDPAGFEIIGLTTGQQVVKSKLLRRRVIERRLGRLIAEEAVAFRPDVVVGGNMPLDAEAELVRACARAKIPFVSWVQDIYSSAIAQYLGGRFGFAGLLIGRHYARLEASLLHSSAAIIAISSGFGGFFEAWGVPASKITIIPNWAPLAELPQVRRENAWARTHKLGGGPIAMYTGTLGLRHDPSLLRDLAQQGRAQGLTVVVTAAGPRADWLSSAKQENLIVLPFQPMEVYPQVLGSADVLLMLLGQEATGFSIPSKVLSYLAAGRPIVASVSEDNDAARTIMQANSGVVVAPADRKGFIKQVLDLANDPERRLMLGLNGRAFAEANFEINAITTRFESVLRGVVKPAAVRTTLASRDA